MEALSAIKGMTEKRQEALSKLGLTNVYELLAFSPKNYVDMDDIEKLSDVASGFCVAKIKIVGSPKVRYLKNRMTITEIAVSDGSVTISCFWFNQPYMAQKDPDKGYLLYGKMDSFNGKKRFVNPVLDDLDKAPTGITPFYSLTKGINQKTMRLLMKHALDYAQKVELFRDSPVLELMGGSLLQSYRDLHFPGDWAALKQAKNHLKYEETLYFACAMDFIHDTAQKAFPISVSEKARATFLSSLPYQLTGAQRRALQQIEQDMQEDKPMNRLLQGDVGCGKTIVAVYAMYSAVENGFQCAFMAPTEVLATQNYEVCRKTLAPFGVEVALLTGHTKKSERKQILQRLKTGEIGVLVGTHALIQDDVEFASLDLVITDEQHRFGVRQRAKLSRADVHTLIMSATPIPRTLALIAFDKLQLSIIDEMPSGRQAISTHIIFENKRRDMYRFIYEECKKGEQAYVVCPLIDQSEMLDAKSATEIYAELERQYGKEMNISLLHGRQKAEDKNNILDGFRDGKVQLLVSTTVVEVGVNVPNATIMVIENAERFGLAQLHQLRGRVGRGSKKSYCFAYTKLPEAIERLQIFKDNGDGLTLAKYDLSTRGMGEFLGFSQSGSYVFQFTDLYKDTEIINLVQAHLEQLKGKPEYKKVQAQTLIRYAGVLDEVILN